MFKYEIKKILTVDWSYEPFVIEFWIWNFTLHFFKNIAKISSSVYCKPYVPCKDFLFPYITSICQVCNCSFFLHPHIFAFIQLTGKPNFFLLYFILYKILHNQNTQNSQDHKLLLFTGKNVCASFHVMSPYKEEHLILS